MHYGQGKWYPGEQLPRWALGCYWRTDGEPIWRQPEFIAKDDVQYGFDEKHARAIHLVRWPTSWKLAPTTRSPHTKMPGITCGKNGACRRMSIRSIPNWKMPEERARLAKIFEQGLQKAIGYVLAAASCVEADLIKPSGKVGQWFFRPERMYLIPGDSPMGYRLPLDSLPWTVPGEDRKFMSTIRLPIGRPLPQFSTNGSQRHGASHPHWPSHATARRQYIHQVAGVGGSAESDIEAVSRIYPRDDGERAIAVQWRRRPRRLHRRPRVAAIHCADGALRSSATRNVARLHAADRTRRKIICGWSHAD